MKILKKSCVYLVAMFAMLSGCAQQAPQYSEAALRQQTATGVQIRASDIGKPKSASVEYIRIKTGRSIFLDPPEGNTDIYLRIGDTSGHDWGGLPLRAQVAEALRKRGYRVVANAKDAAYSLQVNILIANEASAAEIAKLDETRYGQNIGSIAHAALSGAAIGGLGSGLSGGDPNAIAIGAVGGAVVGGVLKGFSNRRKRALLEAQQQTKFFSFITDVEIRERAKGTVHRKGTTKINNNQSSGTSDSTADISTSGGESFSGSEVETYEESSTWKRHRTRMIGKAKGKLVVFEDVQADFSAKMVRAIAGLF